MSGAYKYSPQHTQNELGYSPEESMPMTTALEDLKALYECWYDLNEDFDRCRKGIKPIIEKLSQEQEPCACCREAKNCWPGCRCGITPTNTNSERHVYQADRMEHCCSCGWDCTYTSGIYPDWDAECARQWKEHVDAARKTD